MYSEIKVMDPELLELQRKRASLNKYLRALSWILIIISFFNDQYSFIFLIVILVLIFGRATIVKRIYPIPVKYRQNTLNTNPIYTQEPIISNQNQQAQVYTVNFCQYCGEQLFEGSTFCESCGKKVEN